MAAAVMMALVVMPLSIRRVAVIAIVMTVTAVARRIVVTIVVAIPTIAIAIIVRPAIVRAMCGDFDQRSDYMRGAAMRISMIRIAIVLGASGGAGKKRKRGKCGKEQGLHWKPPLETRKNRMLRPKQNCCGDERIVPICAIARPSKLLFRQLCPSSKFS